MSEMSKLKTMNFIYFYFYYFLNLEFSVTLYMTVTNGHTSVT